MIAFIFTELIWKNSSTYCSTRGGAILSGPEPPIYLPAILHDNEQYWTELFNGSHVKITFHFPTQMQAEYIQLNKFDLNMNSQDKTWHDSQAKAA